MKKTILAFAVLLTVVLSTFFGTSISAAASTVYVSDNGSDLAVGSADAPYKTLEKALSEVSNNGTVEIVGAVTLPKDFSWEKHGKTITLTGGTLNGTALSSLVIGDNVTFKNITLTFDAADAILANGYKVKVDSGVTVTNPCNIYGGGVSGSTVASTDLTVLSGNFARIYGGSMSGTVTGNTNLTVGGSTNASCNASDHNSTYCVYGGGSSDTVKGSTFVTFTGNAKANYVYGGSTGSAEIGVSSNLTVSGGNAMSLYGGSNASKDTTSDSNLTMTGGSFQQVFGGSIGAHQTGNVTVVLSGGTITRRVYGGCYNEWEFSWKSANYVKGNVTVIVNGGVNISFSSSDSDRALFAHSRQKTLSSTEHSTLILGDATAYNNYKDKLGTNDLIGLGALVMGTTAAADAIHYYTYTADAATSAITEKCAYHSDHAATAAITLNPSAALTYTGSEIKPAVLTHSSDWETAPLTLTYRNNVNAGEATVSVSKGDVTASLTFTIEKASVPKPTLTAVNETIKGKNDGSISGLSTQMEYGTDGTTYSAVTDVNGSFVPGTYYIRVKETDNYLASEAVTVTVAEGRMLKITFVAEGSPDIVREVVWNGTLTDIPAVPAREGYTETPPVWSETNFAELKTDMTVYAVYVPNPGAETSSRPSGGVVVVPSDTTTVLVETTPATEPEATVTETPDDSAEEEGTTDEASETTSAVVTDGNVTEPEIGDDTVAYRPEEGGSGCGGVMTSSAVIVSMLSILGAGIVLKKRAIK